MYRFLEELLNLAKCKINYFRFHKTNFTQFVAFHCSLQFRYGRHWASTHPELVVGTPTEILFEQDEVLTSVTSVTGDAIDTIQFATNLSSFPSLGNNRTANRFIIATELLYFTGSETVGPRVYGLAARASTCSME